MYILKDIVCPFSLPLTVICYGGSNIPPRDICKILILFYLWLVVMDFTLQFKANYKFKGINLSVVDAANLYR